MPENTMPAYRSSWSIKGAIPEVDIRTTLDGKLVCIHDTNISRTINAPNSIAEEEINKLTLSEIRKYDAGIKFNIKYKGLKIPTLEEVLIELQDNKEKEIYLDIKSADLSQLKAVIKKYHVEDQIIFVHNSMEYCEIIADLYKNARCMTWFEGNKQQITKSFEAASQTAFKGIKELQIHLHAKVDKQKIHYHIDKMFLSKALEETKKYNVDLMVRPFLFDRESLSYLLSLGIRLFAVDGPKLFFETLNKAMGVL